MTRELIAPPDIEPIDLSEATEHLRGIVPDDEATLVEALIVAARERAETFTERGFISQAWAFYCDEFPAGVVRLPLTPVMSVESIKYFDTSGVEQTLDPAEYFVDTKSKPARLVPVTSWPSTFCRPNSITIAATVGYGTEASDVPQTIKQAMLLMVADMYENRETVIVGTISSSIPMTAELLLQPFRLTI